MSHSKFYLEHYGLNRHVIVKAYKCDEGCRLPFYYHGNRNTYGTHTPHVRANNTCDHFKRNSADQFEYCLDCREWGEQS